MEHYMTDEAQAISKVSSIHKVAEYGQQKYPFKHAPVPLHFAKIIAWCGLMESFVVGSLFLKIH